MPDKGNIMSQTFYERQSKMLKLIQEAFIREEMNVKETVAALRMIGFSQIVATNRVNEWKAHGKTYEQETEKEKKRRQKEQISLEMYLLRTRIGQKKYKEYMAIRSKYKNKGLSRNDTVIDLMEFGYSRKFSDCTIDKWEMEKM